MARCKIVVSAPSNSRMSSLATIDVVGGPSGTVICLGAADGGRPAKKVARSRARRGGLRGLAVALLRGK